MKVILKQDVAKVGKKGELIEVSDGYGRNFLVGRGLADEATPGKVREYQEHQKTQKAKDDKRQKAAAELKKTLGGKVVTVKASAGEGGKLFGSVTSAQVPMRSARSSAAPSTRRTSSSTTPSSRPQLRLQNQALSRIDAEMTLKVETE